MGKKSFLNSISIFSVIIVIGFQFIPGEILAESKPLSSRFHLGVEYMMPGLAEIYAKMGVTWAKGRVVDYRWYDVEPRPPVNGKHNYSWERIDRIIMEYQKAGFKNFHIYTEARNKWASSKSRFMQGPLSVLPKPEYLKYYGDYIRNLVERYDGDGKDDMPGLLYPVRYWEIEGEWWTFWSGTVDEYIQLLRIAHKAVKEADPQAKVILVGFLMMGWFDGDFSEKELEQRFFTLLPRQQKFIRKVGGEIRELLKYPELFDIVEFHSLSDWTEIIGTTDFLRREMQKNGYEKPIWAGDVNYSINPMMFHGGASYPYVKKQKRAILKTFDAMKRKGNPQHAQTKKWFRAEQAKFTAKKIVCGMGEGLRGMNIGHIEVSFTFRPITRFTGTFAFTALVDPKGFRSGGKNWAIRIPGEPRPVYWTIKMLLNKLGPYSRVARLKLRRGIYAYHFSHPIPASGNSSDLTILWYEDGKGQLPGDPEPKIQFSLPVQGAKATFIPVITEIGQKRPDGPKPLPVRNGQVSLELTESPILIMHGLRSPP